MPNKGQSTPAQVEAFFGSQLKELKGNHFAGQSFRKDVKLGTIDLQIDRIEVSYSTGSMTAKLKLDVTGNTYEGRAYGWFAE